MHEPDNTSDPAGGRVAPASLMGRFAQKLHGFLSSAKLAIALLVAIFVSCIAGVTVFRGDRAWSLIFETTWFNGLLVLLVVNVAFCFFGRIWRRKLTLVTFGMILFHLSFVAIFTGIIYNSLFYFHGNIRLTEGESLPSSDPASYDVARHGRFFDYSRLKGNTALHRMHKGYKVEGKDKVVAYEVSVGEEGAEKWGVVYITKALKHNGFRYLREKEGYSILVILNDETTGDELYGAYYPLQSIRQDDGTYLYTSGTKEGPGSFPYPSSPEKHLFHIQTAYTPSKFEERGGEVSFTVWPFSPQMSQLEGEPLAKGKVAMGEKLSLGKYSFSVNEVRYWVGMEVLYDPGFIVVLSSLWVGFAGIVITFIARLRIFRSRSSGV